MTAAEFRRALAGFDLSGRQFARLFNVDERTVRRWKAGELDVSRWVPVVIELMGLARHWGAAGQFDRWVGARYGSEGGE